MGAKVKAAKTSRAAVADASQQPTRPAQGAVAPPAKEAAVEPVVPAKRYRSLEQRRAATTRAGADDALAERAALIRLFGGDPEKTFEL